MSFAPMVTEAIRWRVPQGPHGVMGWSLTSSGTPVLPQAPGGFLVTAGESGTWMLEGLHTSGDWHVTAYNTGRYPHTVYLQFLVSPVSKPLTRDYRLSAIAGLAMANLAPVKGG